MKKVLLTSVFILLFVSCNLTHHYHEGAEDRRLAKAAADSIANRMRGWEIADSTLWECPYSRKEDKDGNMKVFYYWVATYRVTDGTDTLIITTDSHQWDTSDQKHEYYFRGRVSGRLIGTSNEEIEDIRRQNLAMRRVCEGKEGFRLEESGAHVLSADVEIFGPVVEELPRSAYGLE